MPYKFNLNKVNWEHHKDTYEVDKGHLLYAIEKFSDALIELVSDDCYEDRLKNVFYEITQFTENIYTLPNYIKARILMWVDIAKLSENDDDDEYKNIGNYILQLYLEMQAILTFHYELHEQSLKEI